MFSFGAAMALPPSEEEPRPLSLSPEPEVVAVPNALLDAGLEEIRRKIVENGYSELPLPPSSHEFTEKTLGIQWNGTLVLTNGKLSGLETLHRVGEATISFNEVRIFKKILISLVN